MSLKAVHYINQFYAGIGGETMADTGFGILKRKKGLLWALSSFGMER